MVYFCCRWPVWFIYLPLVNHIYVDICINIHVFKRLIHTWWCPAKWVNQICAMILSMQCCMIICLLYTDIAEIKLYIYHKNVHILYNTCISCTNKNCSFSCSEMSCLKFLLVQIYVDICCLIKCWLFYYFISEHQTLNLDLRMLCASIFWWCVHHHWWELFWTTGISSWWYLIILWYWAIWLLYIPVKYTCIIWDYILLVELTENY